MSLEVLGKLFSSTALVKIMRLFLFNPEQAFDTADIARRANVAPATVRTEIAVLKSVGLIKRKAFTKEIVTSRGRKKVVHKRKTQGWTLDMLFPYIPKLHDLLIDTNLVGGREIERRLRRAGRIKMLLVAGVFIQDQESRVDLLIVGDNLKRGAVDSAIKLIEADIGTELRYAVFETSEFLYRMGVYDKLIRDILDYPHQTVINRLEVNL